MKKLSVLLLLLLVSVLLIVSCGDDKVNGDTNQTNDIQTNTPNQTGDPQGTHDPAQTGDPTGTDSSNQTDVPPETDVIVPADKVETFKINGVDLSKYMIFALDGIEEGEALAKTIGEKLGVNMRVESGLTVPEGNTWLILDRQSYAYHDWSITVENGNLHIKGSYRSFPKAIEHFESYLDGSKGADVNITASHSIEGKIDKVTPLYSTKEELLSIYQYAADSGYTLYGEHWGGGFNMLSDFATAFYNCVGDAPAILDTDMVGFYLGNFSRSMISQIICECLEFAARGGIVTTHCHWQNPNEKTREDTIYRGSIGSKELWTSVLTEGTEFNKRWKEQLDFNAEVYQAFEDVGLPVTFRPMIEGNSGNMWWCYYHEDCMLTGDDLRDMWNYVQSYYVDELGLDNILWTYSPNAYTGGTTYTTLYYPGDDKCDLVGMDWYIDVFHSRNLANGYGYQDLLAYGKPTGLCEWGVTGGLGGPSKGQISKNFSCQELVDIINLAKDAGLTLTFLETYMGSFGSATRMPDPEVLNNSAGIILLDDMPDIIRNALG